MIVKANRMSYCTTVALLTFLGLSTTIQLVAQANLATAEKPNIILINVDDLGWKDLGIYGSLQYRTPHIDQLAGKGMLFTNAYASASNCAPSRACMLTGLSTPRHGIFTVANSDRGNKRDRKLIPIMNVKVLADSFVTIAEMLKEVGYYSISIGKWHLSEDPRFHGFDENIAGTHAGHPRTYFSPYQIETLPDGQEGEYLIDRMTNEAIGFVEKNRDRPFFLYLPYFAVHTPLMAPEELVKHYDSQKMIDGQSDPVYAAMIESLDGNVGRLMQRLESLDLMDNTCIILTSDNGGIRAVSTQAPLRGGKGSYYEGGIRVPLIVCWKGRIRAGSTCDEPVTNLDFFPTIRELADSKMETSHLLDGESLWPLLLETGSLEERYLFWHFPIYLQKYDGQLDDARDSLFRTRPGTAMRFGSWKLHEYFEDNALELYNIELDPGERKNLADDYPDIASELHAKMIAWRKDQSAPVPTEPNPNYIPH